jgi:hypothetical protein
MLTRSFALAMEGERVILAFSTPGSLLATAFEGYSFRPPLTVYSSLLAEQRSLAVGGYAPSGAIYLAWSRGDYELVLSRGRPKRPCE